MTTVFKRKDREIYCYKVKLGYNCWKEFPGFVDKRATEEKCRQHQAQIDRGEVGLVDPYADHKARPLEKHIADYINELHAKGRDEMYCDNSERFLVRMTTECGWNRSGDVTPDSIIKWRDNLMQILQARNPRADGRPLPARKPKAASAKTKNIYLATAKEFCNWMVQRDRMIRNPLACVGAVEERGNEVRVRRALSDDETIRLLDVAGKYRIVYLTALTTGLRRGEMSALTWGDVHLNSARPFINVRASISKNHKTATMFLRQDVADGLRAIAGDDTGLVFDMPGRKRFQSHLKAAGIDAKDKAGRIIDFHSLRHSFITGLSKAGVSPRVAMELARHSQIDLTMRTYTDAGMLGTADAVNALPSWSKPVEQERLAAATGTDDMQPSLYVPTNDTKDCSQSVFLRPEVSLSPVETMASTTSISTAKNAGLSSLSDNRGDRIRTCALLVPNQAL